MEILYFSQDVNEIVITIGNHKFRMYEDLIKHFIDGTKLVEKVDINKERFYEFANYAVTITNRWNEFATIGISPESKWSVVIKTNKNGTKRYAGIQNCPNNWNEFCNTFDAFFSNKPIERKEERYYNSDNLSYENKISLEYNKNGVNEVLINEILEFAIKVIAEFELDKFWSDKARSFFGLLIVANLNIENKINVKKLLNQISDINVVKNLVMSNIEELKKYSELNIFINSAGLISSDKTLDSVLKLINDGLTKYITETKQTDTNDMDNTDNEEIKQDLDNENDIEQCLHFTDFNKLNIIDDETEDYDLVCGIRIETNYVGGTVEQLNLYDVPKGSVFHFNYNEAEIIDITQNEIVLRTDNTIELSKIQSKSTKETNKIDLQLKVNEFITGWSTMPIPMRVLYKIKVLYVRKKEQLEY